MQMVCIMGRENTIQWLASVELDQREDPVEEDMNAAMTEAVDKSWEENNRIQESIPQVIMALKQRTWKEATICFWQSQKGTDLSMGSSIVYCINLVVIGLAIMLSDILTGANDIVSQKVIYEFFIVMYLASIAATSAFLILGFCGKLTIDKGHKPHKNTFTRSGMVVLGSGGMIYEAMVIAVAGMGHPECVDSLEIANTVLAMVSTILQVSFLVKHSSTRINSSLRLALVSRILLMQIIATNICVWLSTIIEETLHEIHFAEAHSLSGNSTPPLSNVTECLKTGTLSSIVGPYLFPLMIEFCVVASTIILGVWEKTGLGLKVNEEIMKNKKERIVAFTGVPLVEEDENEAMMENPTDAATTIVSSHDENIKYESSNSGFVFGWICLVTSIVIVIVDLYNAYAADGNVGMLSTMAYASNLTYSGIVFVMVILAFKQMSVLTFKDDEIKHIRHASRSLNLNVPTEKKVSIARNLDKSLINLTFWALLAFKLMCMIAGFEKGDWLLFIDGLVSIVVCLTQGFFISWFAFEKRSTKEIHRATKPGRQLLEVLRSCNLGLWFINTFLVKNPLSKEILNVVFGHRAWVIISNIVQPLTILYYFHCTMCLAEIIHGCYTTKYIGITRKSKRLTESSYSSKADLNGLLSN